MTTRTRRGTVLCLPQHRCVVSLFAAYLFRPTPLTSLVFFFYSSPAQPNPQKSRSQFVIAAPVVAAAAPPAVGLGVASTSVSPSPFAPPPGPVSLPLPSSSSSTHLTAKAKSPDVVRVHPEQLAPSSGLDLDTDGHPTGPEYVMENMSTCVLHPDDGDAGNSTGGHLNAVTHDPPDPPQPRAPSRQVCLSSPAVLFSACVYPYVSVIESSAPAFGYRQSLLVISLPTALAEDPFVPSFPD